VEAACPGCGGSTNWCLGAACQRGQRSAGPSARSAAASSRSPCAARLVRLARPLRASRDLLPAAIVVSSAMTRPGRAPARPVRVPPAWPHARVRRGPHVCPQRGLRSLGSVFARPWRSSSLAASSSSHPTSLRGEHRLRVSKLVSPCRTF
jgi:hypothetical protein